MRALHLFVLLTAVAMDGWMWPTRDLQAQDLPQQSAVNPETTSAAADQLLNSNNPQVQLFTRDDQDFYLFQAWQASDASKRQAIHHIGAQFEFAEGHFVISNLLEAYPAINAGLRRGDIMLSIDGKAFHPVNSFNPGSGAAARVLNFLRDGQQLSVELQPVYENLYDSMRRATVNSVSRYPSGNKLVCYVHWWAASRSLADILADRDLFSSMRSCDGLVLDLRGAFGYFDWSHLDFFFNSRTNFPLIRKTNASTEIEYRAPPRDPYLQIRSFDRPIALLINENTRGGMELIAHQLIKSSRAISVGIPTAGLVADIEQLSGDAETGWLMYLPVNELFIDGVNLQHLGAKPQLLQEWPIRSSTSNDPQFDTALLALMGII